MPATLAPPPAPAAPAAPKAPAPAAPKPAAAPKAPAPPAPAINLSDLPTSPKDPAKPGSPRERLFKDLSDTIAKKSAPPATRQVPEPPKGGDKLGQVNAPPDPNPPSPPADVAQTPEEIAAAEAAKAAQPAAPAAPAPAKPSPWKIAETWKARAEAAELKLAEKEPMPEVERKALTEKWTKIEEENKLLRDEIRYVNYSKSPEFQEKFDAPYRKAIEEAMFEFKDFQITDVNGNVRAVTGEDLMTIAAAPVQQARAMANELFGEFAPDVMNHRRDIQKLFAQRQAALDDWKQNGEKHLKERAEGQAKEWGKLSESIGNTWKKSSEALLKDEKYGKYFNPVEGDQEGNQKLAKGFEMADRAFNEDPRDPTISADERATRVKRHAAVRARAAAFGKLVYLNTQLEAKVNELMKELKQFKDSEPGIYGTDPSGAPQPAVSGMEAMKQALRQRAR